MDAIRLIMTFPDITTETAFFELLESSLRKGLVRFKLLVWGNYEWGINRSIREKKKKKDPNISYLKFVIKKKVFQLTMLTPNLLQKQSVVRATPAPLELDDELIDDECASHASDEESEDNDEDEKTRKWEADLAEKHRLQDEEDARLKAEHQEAFAIVKRSTREASASDRQKAYEAFSVPIYGEISKKKKKTDLMDRDPDPLGGI
jgi:hypothetical protein